MQPEQLAAELSPEDWAVVLLSLHEKQKELEADDMDTGADRVCRVFEAVQDQVTVTTFDLLVLQEELKRADVVR